MRRVVKRLLEKSSKQTREAVNKLLNYPESSGRQPDDHRVCPPAQGLDRGQLVTPSPNCASDAETVYTCYVVSETACWGGVCVRPAACCSPT